MKIFCFPLSLLSKHGVDFKITNTAQKKCSNMQLSEQRKVVTGYPYVSQTALHAVVFLDHNPAMGSFKAIAARIFF